MVEGRIEIRRPGREREERVEVPPGRVSVRVGARGREGGAHVLGGDERVVVGERAVRELAAEEVSTERVLRGVGRP